MVVNYLHVVFASFLVCLVKFERHGLVTTFSHSTVYSVFNKEPSWQEKYNAEPRSNQYNADIRIFLPSSTLQAFPTSGFSADPLTNTSESSLPHHGLFTDIKEAFFNADVRKFLPFYLEALQVLLTSGFFLTSLHIILLDYSNQEVSRHLVVLRYQQRQ